SPSPSRSGTTRTRRTARSASIGTPERSGRFDPSRRSGAAADRVSARPRFSFGSLGWPDPLRPFGPEQGADRDRGGGAAAAPGERFEPLRVEPRGVVALGLKRLDDPLPEGESGEVVDVGVDLQDTGADLVEPVLHLERDRRVERDPPGRLRIRLEAIEF